VAPDLGVPLAAVDQDGLDRAGPWVVLEGKDHYHDYLEVHLFCPLAEQTLVDPSVAQILGDPSNLAGQGDPLEERYHDDPSWDQAQVRPGDQLVVLGHAGLIEAAHDVLEKVRLQVYHLEAAHVVLDNTRHVLVQHIIQWQ